MTSNEQAQTLKKIADRESVLFLISYILFSFSKREVLPIEILPYTGIPVLFNFWLLTKHYPLMKGIISDGHPKKMGFLIRFYLNLVLDVVLLGLILFEVFK